MLCAGDRDEFRLESKRAGRDQPLHRPAISMQFKPIRYSGDKRGMRRLLWIGLIVCLSTSTGCMVMDELDAAAAKMPVRTKSDATDKDEAVASTTGATAKENPLLQESKRWWKRATSLEARGLDASIVSCRLPGGTQFMSRNNCLSRGGDPQSVSG